ncbi:hypothetical protein [Trichococcus sp.]|uniref:hypothetical protein n=1 Tax=Trichococcus sp. TaxID=1985464 RepID=UPI003C7C7D03
MEQVDTDTDALKNILQDVPETDSHPDAETAEDELEQETTYVPGDEDKAESERYAFTIR